MNTVCIMYCNVNTTVTGRLLVAFERRKLDIKGPDSCQSDVWCHGLQQTISSPFLSLSTLWSFTVDMHLSQVRR